MPLLLVAMASNRLAMTSILAGDSKVVRKLGPSLFARLCFSFLDGSSVKFNLFLIRPQRSWSVERSTDVGPDGLVELEEFLCWTKARRVCFFVQKDLGVVRVWGSTTEQVLQDLCFLNQVYRRKTWVLPLWPNSLPFGHKYRRFSQLKQSSKWKTRGQFLCYLVARSMTQVSSWALCWFADCNIQLPLGAGFRSECSMQSEARWVDKWSMQKEHVRAPQEHPSSAYVLECDWMNQETCVHGTLLRASWPYY